MKSVIWRLSVWTILLLSSCGGTEFNVGISRVSIEPTEETPSLTLAGYASPWEGRFSLRWDFICDNELRSTAVCGDSIIILDNSGNIYKELNNQGLEKHKKVKLNNKIGCSPSLKKIAYFHGFVYGLLPDGKLVRAKLEKSLEKWDDFPLRFKVKNIVASSNYMYLFDESNFIYTHEGFKIEENERLEGEILDITSDSYFIYALLGTNEIYRIPLDLHSKEWLKIWYKNEENKVGDLNSIFYIDSHMCAASCDGNLYKSSHSSVGDLEINAWSIGEKRKKVVIVAADLCGLDKSFVDDVKQEIERRRGIDASSILINVSHTHFAPVTQSWATWQKPNQSPDSVYLMKVIRPRMIQAIEESLDNMVPSKLYFGRDTCAIGINRSLRGADAIYDNTVDVLIAESKVDKKKNVLFLTGCHPVFTDPEVNVYTLNANYPGYSRSLLEHNEKIGNTMFLQACAGDINPKSPYKDTGSKLANSVNKILSGDLLPIKCSGISSHFDSIIPPVEEIVEKDDLMRFKREYEGQKGMIAERNLNWANIQLNSIKNDGDLPPMVVYYQTINIGNWKLVALSREVTSEYGVAIKNIWPNDIVSVIAYSNDVPSYLGTPPHVQARDYEGYESFLWYGQPFRFSDQAFSCIVDKIKETNY